MKYEDFEKFEATRKQSGSQTSLPKLVLTSKPVRFDEDGWLLPTILPLEEDASNE